MKFPKIQIKYMNCFNCKYLNYFESYFESSCDSGYFCEGAKKYDREEFPSDEKFLSTPKPRCFKIDMEKYIYCKIRQVELCPRSPVT